MRCLGCLLFALVLSFVLCSPVLAACTIIYILLLRFSISPEQVSRFIHRVSPRPILPAACPQPRTRAKRFAIRLKKKKTRVWWTINRSIDNCQMGCLLAENRLRRDALAYILSPRHYATLEPARKKKKTWDTSPQAPTTGSERRDSKMSTLKA